MNHNYSRYMDSITAVGMSKNTFLNNWHKKVWKIFYDAHEEEFRTYNDLWFEEYENSSFGEFAKKEKEIKKHNPQYTHRFTYFFVSLPDKIESWLCCGFRWKYDRTLKQWTWFENYHMMDKLCRYETWENVKITWWDKLRFKWITGYDFE